MLHLFFSLTPQPFGWHARNRFHPNTARIGSSFFNSADQRGNVQHGFYKCTKLALRAVYGCVILLTPNHVVTAWRPCSYQERTAASILPPATFRALIKRMLKIPHANIVQQLCLQTWPYKPEPTTLKVADLTPPHSLPPWFFWPALEITSESWSNSAHGFGIATAVPAEPQRDSGDREEDFPEPNMSLKLYAEVERGGGAVLCPQGNTDLWLCGSSV